MIGHNAVSVEPLSLLHQSVIGHNAVSVEPLSLLHQSVIGHNALSVEPLSLLHQSMIGHNAVSVEPLSLLHQSVIGHNTLSVELANSRLRRHAVSLAHAQNFTGRTELFKNVGNIFLYFFCHKHLAYNFDIEQSKLSTALDIVSSLKQRRLLQSNCLV